MRIAFRRAVAAILGMLLTLHAQGCVRKPASPPVEHTVRKVPSEPPGIDAEPTKEDFERRLRDKLDRLDEEIRETRERVATLGKAARAEWEEKMADLDAKRKAAEARLAEVRRAAHDAWEHLRDGAVRAWEDLEQAVRNARNES